jgi:hypothetical protein
MKYHRSKSQLSLHHAEIASHAEVVHAEAEAAEQLYFWDKAQRVQSVLGRWVAEGPLTG